MKKLTVLATCLLILMASNAQTDSVQPRKPKIFIASIQGMDRQFIKGRLIATNDSQLVLKSYSGELSVPAGNIKSFTLKRKHSVLRGTLFGFGIGAVTGIIVGLASGSDPIMTYDPNNDPTGFGGLGVALNNAFAMTAGEKAAAGGILMGTTGAIVGAVVGALAKKKFVIGGKRQKFHDLQGQVMMKLVRK